MPDYTTVTKDVLIFLEESNGKKYRITELAKIFKVAAASMNVIIATLGLKVSMTMSSAKKHYHVKTQEELAEEDRCKANKPVNRMNSKPYVLSTQMRDAQKRVAELYPDGGNFKSIS